MFGYVRYCLKVYLYLCLAQAMANKYENIISHNLVQSSLQKEHLKSCTFISPKTLTLPTNLGIWIVGVGISSKVPRSNILCWLWWYADEDWKMSSKYPSNNCVEHSKECRNLAYTTNSITNKYNNLEGKSTVCYWKTTTLTSLQLYNHNVVAIINIYTITPALEWSSKYFSSLFVVCKLPKPDDVHPNHLLKRVHNFEHYS